MKSRSPWIEPLEARIAPAFAAVFELSSLDGLNGFKVNGATADDLSGVSVSDAGDVNGDGIDDLLIGALLADPNGSNSGASYVVFGDRDGFAATLNLSTLDGANGFKINGVATDDQSGYSVSTAGDVNGDGFDDLIIGALGADPNGSYSGASYVVFGKAGGFAPTLNLSTLNGVSGFKINGQAAGDSSGRSVSGAGDVNGDGFDDLIIGALGADPNGSYSGASYVVFGKAAGFGATLNLSTLNGTNGFKINGSVAVDYSGVSVSGAGDVNGDGFDDLIIGALGADPNGSLSGASYVVFGKAGPFAPALNLSTLNGANGFKINGQAAGDTSGRSVSGAGDVNGDGFDDLIIGALGADPNGANSGASYVVFGKAAGFGATLNLSTLNGANGFKINGAVAGDYSGFPVSGAGDVNGDGFGDLIIGALQADPNGSNSGASYIVFGNAGGFAPTLNLSTLNGANGFKINGAVALDYSGRSVSGAGDVNGDGFDDLIIGALQADPNGSNSGASYVVFGSSTVTLTIGDASVAESNAGTTDLAFTVTLSAASTVPVSVRYTTQSGTALAGSDFSGVVNELLTFAPGETSKTITIRVAGDTTHELDETLSVALSDATNATILDPDEVGRGTIVNDDAPPLVSIADASVLESDTGTSSIVFTVSLSAASGLPATVNFASADGTALAGSDYTSLAPGTLSFARGETTKTITVEVLGDASIEDHETFSVMLTEASGATIGAGTAVGTILNDDTALRIVAPADGLEGDSGATPFVFTVSLEKASALPVTVNYATTDGTASAGSDFAAPPAGAQISFAPGETSKTITVDGLGDTSIEDHETFSVVLSGATNAALVIGTATSTILNDDTALRISDVSAREDDSGTTPFGFTISLEKASALPVTVSYSTADGTAIAGSDFTAPPAGAQISFAPGETTKSVSIGVTGDTEVEAHETFSVILSAATGAVIADGTGTGTILNDETLVRISDASLLEGHSGTRTMTFTVSLTAASALPVSVNFTSADGTATSGTDYTALTPGTLNFAPGETSKTLTVDLLGDTAVEASETFSIVLADATNAVIDDGTGVGTILDDDVTLAGPRKATFTDADGDLVRIKVSRGTLKVEDFTIVPSGLGAQLALVDFSGEAEFAGTKLSITAKRAAGAAAGVRSVDVGYINASGIDLGKVVVKGDLGQIDAGNDADRKPGVLSLSANSIGHRGLDTQLPGGSLQSDIVGALKTLKLADGMHDAALSASGDIGAVAIKGSVLGSALRSDGKIGAIKITGDLAASATNAATISARGTLAPSSNAKALAIASLSIGGSVNHAQILAGYDLSGAAANADAGIGAVSVGRNWIASSLIAGVTAGPDSLFGTDDDEPISRATSITSKIASILIKGTATGTEGGADHFGFVSEQIGAFKAGGAKLALTRGPSNDLTGLPVGITGDLNVREVA